MSVEIKVYLTQTQSEDNLCFHAVVNSKDDYDLFVDLNETYESLMLDTLNGKLEFEYFDKENFDKHLFSINENQYAESLNQFAQFLQEFYGLCVVVHETNLISHFGVRLVGAGFRGNSENPMLEHAQFNARNSIHGIKTQLFTPTNDSDYRSDDIYIKQMHGSLKLTLEATKKYEEPIVFIKSIYDDIENEAIDPFKFIDKNQQYRYQTIIKNLNDLNTQKKLSELYVIIDGAELQITKRTYLKDQAKHIYREDIELIGVFDSYKKRSNSLEMYVSGRGSDKGQFFCHLDELKNHQYSSFESILEKIKDLDTFSSTRIRVHGKKVKPKTINVTSLEILA